MNVKTLFKNTCSPMRDGIQRVLQKKEKQKSLFNLLDLPSNLLVPRLRNFKALRSSSSLWMCPEDTHVKKVV